MHGSRHGDSGGRRSVVRTEWHLKVQWRRQECDALLRGMSLCRMWVVRLLLDECLLILMQLFGERERGRE